MQSAWRPRYPIQSRTPIDDDASGGHLRILIQIPQIQPTGIIDSGEQRRVRRRPSDVVDIVAVVLERVERLVLFQAPEFDSPVEGGRQE